MNINQFIHDNRIRPADCIVVRKEFLGLLKHYVIYLGADKGRHTFIANYGDGVKIIPTAQLLQFLNTYRPVKINRFAGTEAQRNAAVKRALSRTDENAYDLIVNNCEHFANWVQTGEARSEQADNFRGGLLAAGLIGLLLLAFSTNNDS